jgi:uncharacterized membrane protein
MSSDGGSSVVAFTLASMVLAGVATWPLQAAGVAVAIIVYVALGYLLVSGIRLVITTVRQMSRNRRDADRARIYDGQAHPTLFDVAVARAVQDHRAGPSKRQAA